MQSLNTKILRYMLFHTKSFWYCKIFLFVNFIAKFVVMMLQIKTFYNLCKS